MKAHVNIPIFIPHLGCPNQCVFCNQRNITGVSEFDPKSLKCIIEEGLSTVKEDKEVEIAFFGGSFTGIDRGLMIELLSIADQYVKDGRVSSVRCSTRPDYIDDEILDILCKYSVKTVELGLQSTDDEVLSLTKRGHSFEDERLACDRIVSRGLNLVGQMMVGLPGSSKESEMRTAEFIANSGAKEARVYPTVVFRETELCMMAKNGSYIPLSTEEAVRRSASVVKYFYDNGVEVIRIGLCASENLSDASSYYAGPNHPAIGELVENEIFYDVICDKLKKLQINQKILTVRIPKGSLSKAIGQKKKNRLRLIAEFGLKDIVFLEDSSLKGYGVECEERKI